MRDNHIHFPRSVLSSVIGVLFLTAMASPASGENITITDSTREVGGDQTANRYRVGQNGQLKFARDTVLGTGKTPLAVLIAENNAIVNVSAGAVINGRISFNGASQGYFGTDSEARIYASDTVALSDNSSAIFGNILIENGKGNHGQAVVISDSAHASFGAGSLLQATGSKSYGALVRNSSSADFNGANVRGVETGILAQDSSRVSLNNTTVSGQTSGIVIYDRANLTVSNGSIISEQGGAGTGAHGLQGAGINIIGLASEGGSSTVTVKDGAVIKAKGGDSAGISSRMYGASATNIMVADSAVIGGKYGILVDQDATLDDGDGTAGTTDILLSGAQVSGGNEAIHINQRGKATIRITAGSLLNGGNGVVLKTDADSLVNADINKSQITGNLVNNGTTSLSLHNNSSWTGAMKNVSNMSLDAGTNWHLTDSSTVTGNLANGGTINLASQVPGTELTVQGNYTGNNGTLLFSSALGADNSVTDRMVVNGNTSGTTNIAVTNAGGTGALTLNGIELIRVNGNSAGEFKQQGRIAAGAYDYRLVRGKSDNAGSWYLSSEATRPTPGPDKNVIRPEAGSYIANQQASTMFLTTLHDRAGENRYMNTLDAEGNVTSLWLRQTGGHSSFHDNSGQLRTQGNTYIAQLGGDVAQWSTNDHDRWHLGAMAGYGNNRNHTHSIVSGYNSRGTVDGYSVGTYSTWYQNDTDKTGAWVDGQLLYSWFNNHIQGDDISAESYRSKGLSGSVESGYTFPLGRQDEPTRSFIEPHVQAAWMGVKADGLQESNGTHVQSQGYDNIQTRVGVRVFRQGKSSVDNGTERSFQPFVEVNWLHNTRRNGVTLDGITPSQTGAINVGEVKLGVEAKLTKQTQLWGSLSQQAGGEGYLNTDAMLGIKYSF